MNTYLYAYPAEVDLGENPSMVFSQEYDGGFIYLANREQDYPDQTLIGVWNGDGVAQGPIDPLYQEIRPFRNTKEGAATDRLDFHHWQGNRQRQMQEEPEEGTLPLYPEANQPIILTMERWMDDTPGWEGYGWKATIEFSDPNRPPNSRAIGIYNENWAYLYTTGAFIWTDTGEVDGNGQAIFKWQTKNPAGRATKQPEPLYYALLHGSLQEGRMILGQEQESLVRNFWEKNQAGPTHASGVSRVTHDDVNGRRTKAL